MAGVESTCVGAYDGAMQNMTLGERISKLMHDRDLTQEKLGEIAHVPRRTVQNLIYDKVKNPHTETIVKISKALGVSFEELVGLDGKLVPPPPEPPQTVAGMTPTQLLETLAKATRSETADEAELLRLFRSASPTLRTAILETVRNLSSSK